MKNYIEGLLPKLKSWSRQLDRESILKNIQWTMVDNQGLTDTIYIFRNNNELLVSVSGNVTIGTWEYLDTNTLLVTISDKSFLYSKEYFDDKLLALKKQGSVSYIFFVNNNLIKNKLDFEYYISNENKFEKPKELKPKSDYVIVEKIPDEQTLMNNRTSTIILLFILLLFFLLIIIGVPNIIKH